MNGAKQPPHDQLLLSRYRQGDEDAALQLYHRYAERLFLLAKRETNPQLAVRFDPEDIVQSVFRTFFRRAANGQYEAPGGDELWKLLLVIALNKVRTRALHHMASKRDIRKTAGSACLDNADCFDRDQDQAQRVLELSVRELIDLQPESHHAIIQARIEGSDIQSISDQLGRSKRTVERVLQSFRSRLMKAALLFDDSPTS